MSVAVTPPRRGRIRRLGIVVAVALAAVAAAAVISSSGGSPRPPAAPPAAGAAPTNALFTGLEEHGGVLGDPEAPVTVTEYVDLQCPVCAEAAQTTLPALLRDQVRTGNVKLDARTLQFIGPDSVRAARVAAGARAQGRLWPFLAAFYAAQGPENSGYATDDFLQTVATSAALDADAALAFATTGAAQHALDRADADAQARGIASTPTFTVTGPDGRTRVVVGHDAAALDAAIRAAR